MPDHSSYERSGSTTIVWEAAKIDLPPKATGERRRQASISVLKRLWRRESPLTMTVTSRGGAELWMEIRARGQVYRFPGHRCLADVMLEIWGYEL